MRKLANAPTLNKPYIRSNRPHVALQDGALQDGALQDGALQDGRASSADLTDEDGRIWNYLGRIDAAAAQLPDTTLAEDQSASPLDSALRLRPHLLLNGKVYRLSAADVMVLAEVGTNH